MRLLASHANLFTMSNSDREKVWRSLAGRLVRKVNVGWWLQLLTPLLVVGSLVIGSAILIMRSMWLPIENTWFLIGTGTLIVIMLIVAGIFAKRRFIEQKDGLVRLEEGLSLRNALTAADHGVGQWPAPPRDESSAMKWAGFQWRWPVVITPFAIATLSIAAALLIPIPDLKAAADLPPAEPSAWEQVEKMLDTLEDQEVIEEEAIEEVRDKIVELRAQPEDDWFSHSSMEATDTLRETLRQQINSLGAEMQTAERDLNALQNFSSQMSEEAKDMIISEFEEALKNMELSGLEMNQELLKQLQQMDPKQLMAMSKFIDALKDMGFTEEELNEDFVRDMKALDPDKLAEAQKKLDPDELKEMLKEVGFAEEDLTEEMLEKMQKLDPQALKNAQEAQISKEQMDALREQLKKAGEAMKEMQGLGGGEEARLAELEAWMMKMQGQGPPGQGQGAGNGGINRGPGTAPLFFGAETDLNTKNIEQVKNLDLSKAAPGELLGVGETEHDIDELKVGPKEAGKVKSKGQGGDTVWRESLMPEEKAVLKRYFK